MNRSGQLQATNDVLIEQLINDPDYDIRSNGEIWTRKALGPGRTKAWRLAGTNKNGYRLIRFNNNSKLAAHRIVYRKWVGPLSTDLVINHKDGNGLNNNPSNLELVPQAANNLHRFRDLGHKAVAGHRKISSVIADEIRNMKKEGLTYKQILAIVGPKYGVTSKGTISEIINNKIWNKEVTLGCSIVGVI